MRAFFSAPSPITSTTRVSRRPRGRPKLSAERAQSTEFPRTLLPCGRVNKGLGGHYCSATGAPGPTVNNISNKEGLKAPTLERVCVGIPAWRGSPPEASKFLQECVVLCAVLLTFQLPHVAINP